jgi:hypothetical protein
MLSISMNGSFDNAQWNFVSDLVTLLAAKVTLMLQNHAWGDSGSSLGGRLRRRIRWAVLAAVAALVMLVGTLRVLLLAACDSRVTTVGETRMERSYQ